MKPGKVLYTIFLLALLGVDPTGTDPGKIPKVVMCTHIAKQ